VRIVDAGAWTEDVDVAEFSNGSVKHAGEGGPGGYVCLAEDGAGTAGFAIVFG
jgi:hypothetical protein